MTELPRYEMELSDNERDIRAIPKGASRRSCVFVDADAEHWIKASDHDAYVADVSLRLQQLEQEKATLRKDLSKLACSYCDNVMEFESPEARWTEAGRARQIDHILECPNRPELKLIEKLEASEAALAETRAALQQMREVLVLISSIDLRPKYRRRVEAVLNAHVIEARVDQTGVPREASVPQDKTE